MWSLSSRLFWHLLLGQLISVLMVCVAAAVALILVGIDYFKTRLEHDRDLLLQEIHWHTQTPGTGTMDIDEETLPPIFVQPMSGHYYEVRWNGQALVSPSLRQHRLMEQASEVEKGKEGWGWLGLSDRSSEAGYDEQELYYLIQTLDFDGRQVEVLIAEDFLPIIRLALHAFLALQLLVMLLMALLFWYQRRQLRSVLQPFDQLRTQLAMLSNQEIESLDAPTMQELKPMVEEINRLGERTRERLLRARLASGNLSHSLKTPLAILSNRITDFASQQPGNSECDEAMVQIQRMNSLIDREMKRARVAGLMSRALRVDLTDLIHQLAASLKKLYPAISIELTLPETVPFPGDREDLFELLGNLLDNACKWAGSRVHMALTVDSSSVFIRIQDDGPGVPDSQLDCLHQPGVRADESSKGYGLGLAIVADIVQQYEGTIRYANHWSEQDTESELPGLKVALKLPLKEGD